ncbi:hypothetical protein BLNAU_7962 [Blattamonas nauphoetae]|uniref:Uncharacterized protein n=1 Tax=Blattamonas nauphoetae TaxID=2049346 RepID=A0ABQ9Y071_9EUKA|nr:hypothetical protein BLNAU_7962 [Blattamonas nauphoetae]
MWFFVIASLFAGDIYVAKSGSDSAACTEAAPCASIDGANSAKKSDSDVIKVLDVADWKSELIVAGTAAKAISLTISSSQTNTRHNIIGAGTMTISGVENQKGSVTMTDVNVTTVHTGKQYWILVQKYGSLHLSRAAFTSRTEEATAFTALNEALPKCGWDGESAVIKVVYGELTFDDTEAKDPAAVVFEYLDLGALSITGSSVTMNTFLFRGNGGLLRKNVYCSKGDTADVTFKAKHGDNAFDGTANPDQSMVMWIYNEDCKMALPNGQQQAPPNFGTPSFDNWIATDTGEKDRNKVTVNVTIKGRKLVPCHMDVEKQPTTVHVAYNKDGKAVDTIKDKEWKPMEIIDAEDGWIVASAPSKDLPEKTNWAGKFVFGEKTLTINSFTGAGSHSVSAKILLTFVFTLLML